MRVKSRPGKDQGSAAVEFILVLPVLLLILFGIVDFGRLLNAKITLSQAAHEGARAAAIGDEAAAASVVSRNVGSLASGMDEPIIVACDRAAPGGDATVTLTYHFGFVTPLGMFTFTREDGLTVTVISVVPCL